MGIIATDILIKTMIEGAMADLRKNPWIIDDIFGDMADDTMARADYGHKEVMRAKEWFLQNNMDVYLMTRVDTPRFPCITVVRTSSREMQERDAIGDDMNEIDQDDIDPDNKGIAKTAQQTVSPFSPKAYNKTEGIVTLPDGTDASKMLAGQFLVSKKSGKAYIITGVLSLNSFRITKNIDDDFTNAYIVPPTKLWNLQKELIFLEESFAIGVHAQSDVNQAIWLRQLIQYIFLRYKEAYLERRGFELSTHTIGTIDQNPHFSGAEQVFSCMMSVTGQVEANFIKYAAPKLQGVKAGIRIIDGPRTPEEYQILAQKQGWKMEEDP